MNDNKRNLPAFTEIDSIPGYSEKEGHIEISSSEETVKKVISTGKSLVEFSNDFKDISRPNTFFMLGALFGIVLSISLAQYYFIWYLLSPFVCLLFALTFKMTESWFQSPLTRRINKLKAEENDCKGEINNPKNDEATKKIYFQRFAQISIETNRLILNKKNKNI